MTEEEKDLNRLEKAINEYLTILHLMNNDKAAAYAYIDGITEDAAEQASTEEERKYFNDLLELQDDLQYLASDYIVTDYMKNAGYNYNEDLQKWIKS